MIYVDNYREKFLDNLIILQLWRLAGGFFCLPTGKYIWRAIVAVLRRKYCIKNVVKSRLLQQAKFWIFAAYLRKRNKKN